MTNTSQGPLPNNKQYSQETDIYNKGGIRTHNLGKRAAADRYLRTRGYRDWQFTLMSIDKTTTHKLRVLKMSLATNTFSVPNHLHSFTSSFHESSHTFSFHFPFVWSSTDESRNVRTSSYAPSGHRMGSIALPKFKLVARTGGRSKSRASRFYLREEDLVLTLREAGWASGPGWMFAENLTPLPTRFPALDSPAPSQPPYRLHYPGQVHRQAIRNILSH